MYVVEFCPDDGHYVQEAFMKDYQTALQAKREQLLQSGVLMMDPASVYVDEDVVVGAGTMLLPGTILRGKTVIGANCQIGPQVMLTDCQVGEGCTINASQCEESQIESHCQIGPYTHIRPHCVVGEGSKIGAFVQLKNCNLGKGTKMAHLTYVGDSEVGDNCNFGCGTVTCNYDPPVKIGDGAFIAAATTVTEDIPDDAMVIGRSRQLVKEGWAAANREKKRKQ